MINLEGDHMRFVSTIPFAGRLRWVFRAETGLQHCTQCPDVTLVDGATFDEGTVIVFELIGDDFDAPETLQTYWSSDIDGEFEGGTPPDLPVHCSTVLQICLLGFTHQPIGHRFSAGKRQNPSQSPSTLNEPEIEIVHPTNGETGTEE